MQGAIGGWSGSWRLGAVRGHPEGAGAERRTGPARLPAADDVQGAAQQLSDPALEDALADRISFRAFCCFALDAMTPDETTICRFRNALSEAGLARR